MRLEIHIREVDKSDEPDWEAMGVTRPKAVKANYRYRRCLIDTYDLEYMKEYDKEHTILKCTWMETSVIVKGEYDELQIRLNDLENSDMEE